MVKRSCSRLVLIVPLGCACSSTPAQSSPEATHGAHRGVTIAASAPVAPAVASAPVEPIGPAPEPAAKPAADPMVATGTVVPSHNNPEVAGLINSAALKAFNGDGKACMTDLDKALAIAPEHAGTMEGQVVRSHCLMASDRCDDGKKMLRQALIAKGEAPSKVGPTVEAVSTTYCPSTSGTPAERVQRASGKLNKATAEGDANRCRSEVKILDESWQKVSSKADDLTRSMALSGFMQAARCLGAAGDCQGAWKRHLQLTSLQLTTMPEPQMRDMARLTFDAIAKGCKPKAK